MKKITQNLIRITCTLAITSSAVAQVDLINEDFAAATLSTNARIRTTQTNGNFWTNNKTASDWTVTGAAGFELLSNAGTSLTGSATEGALSQVIDTSTLATDLNSLTLSFDYTVGATATLKFALIGYKANLRDGGNGSDVLMNNGTANGAFQNDTQADIRHGDINLLTGADMAQSITNDLTFASSTSGSHSVTIDLSGYSWSADEAADADPTNTPGLSGSIASIADFDLVVLVVVNDLSSDIGATATTLDNVKLTAVAVAPPPSATWDGDTDVNWATDANWLSDLAPIALNELIFSGTTNAATNNDLTAGTEFNGLTFANTADTESFSLGGNSIILGGDIASSAAASGSITDTISLAMELNDDRTVNTGADHNLDISGIISEDGSARGLTKSGEGTLTLSAANTYTGGTTIKGPVLLNNGDGLGTGLIEIEAAATSHLILDDGLTVDEDITVTAAANNQEPFFLVDNGTATLNGLVTLSAQMRMEHEGTLNFNGGVTTSNNQTFKDAANFNNVPYLSTAILILHSESYSINVTGNTWTRFRVAFGADVAIGVNNALPIANGVELGWNTSVGNNTATFDLNSFDQEVAFIETHADALGLANNQNITGSSGTLTANQADARTYTGRITGGISVVKTGVGTLTLNNMSGIASDYTGTFDIVDGSVVSQSGADFSDFGSVKITSVTAGALNLDYQGTDNVAALDLGAGNVADGEYGSGHVLDTNGVLIGTGTLTVVAPPAPPLVWDGNTNTSWTNPDADSWTGETYNDGDDVQFLDANASAVTISGAVAPDSILVDSTIDYTISGDAINGTTGLTKSGTSTLTLASANTYTGVTSTTSGILIVGDDAALGSVAGNTSIGAGSALRLEGGITLAEPLTVAGNGNATNNGAIQNAGLNTLTGPITLEGSVRLETYGPNTGTDTLTITGGITGDGTTNFIGDFVIDTAPIVLTAQARFGGDGDDSVTTDKKTVINVAGNDWTNSVIFFGGHIELGVADALPVDKDIEFGWNNWDRSISSLDLNGYNQSVQSIKQSSNSVGVGGNVNVTDSSGNGVLTVNDSGVNAEYQGRLTGGLSLVKDGAGILTLNNLSALTDGGAVVPNSYTGSTTVNGGTLVLTAADLDDASTLTVATGAVLQLNHSDIDVVAALNLGGVAQGSGIYNADNSSGYITGTGHISVGSVVPSFASWAAINGVTGGVDGDSDGDGNLNIVEYALDILIDGYEAPGTLTGNTISYPKRAEAVSNGDLLYSIEVSDDLGVTDPWAPVTPTTNDASTISYTFTPGTPVKEFARLNVVTAP
ncbi:MAG: autotransporter-associated beta strand repeat-containing protein [Lentimonas sp.]